MDAWEIFARAEVREIVWCFVCGWWCKGVGWWWKLVGVDLGSPASFWSLWFTLDVGLFINPVLFCFDCPSDVGDCDGWVCWCSRFFPHWILAALVLR